EKIGRIPAVAFHSFFVGDEHWDARAVAAFVKDLLGLIIIRIKLYLRFEEHLARFLVKIVPKDRRRRGEASERIKGLAIFAFAGESNGGAESWQRDLAITRAVEFE